MYIKLKELNYDEISQVVGLLGFLGEEKNDIRAHRIIYKTFYDTNFLVDFNWSNWDKGRKIINSSDAIKGSDLLTLRILITIIVKNDRFNEGSFERAVENGTIRLILERVNELKENF